MTSNATASESQLTVEIMSFSYKAHLPREMFSWEDGRHGGGFVFDCRALPNPGREERFKERTGRDHDVVQYLELRDEVSRYREHVFGLAEITVENYLDRGFQHLNISFGCTGGQHRSVYFAEALRTHLKNLYGASVRILLTHPSLAAKGFLKSGES